MFTYSGEITLARDVPYILPGQLRQKLYPTVGELTIHLKLTYQQAAEAF